MQFTPRSSKYHTPEGNQKLKISVMKGDCGKNDFLQPFIHQLSKITLEVMIALNKTTYHPCPPKAIAIAVPPGSRDKN